jgi:hypothetical protein
MNLRILSLLSFNRNLFKGKSKYLPLKINFIQANSTDSKIAFTTPTTGLWSESQNSQFKSLNPKKIWNRPLSP